MFLNTHTKTSREVEMMKIAQKVQKTFTDFEVPVEINSIFEGLRSYFFTYKLIKPVRMRVIKSFEEDLQHALATKNVEIQAPIPDQKLIGVSVDKKDTKIVLPWKDAMKSEMFLKSDDLVVPIGVAENYEDEYVDVRRLPHLLMGGVSCSGKSMFLHSLICSLTTKHGPDRLRFLMVDPKMCELTLYNDIPHLLTPVITEPKSALLALKWAIRETDRRFELLLSSRTQNIAAYHKKVVDKGGQKNIAEPMPYILIVIDEIADLMATYPKEFEATFVRIAERSRTVGIHLILSTQRPDTKVITGLIKAKIPSRVAFAVHSYYDSRVILDQVGAEKLEGMGDMLIHTQEFWKARRIQGYFISEKEIREHKKQLIKKWSTTDLDSISPGTANIHQPPGSNDPEADDDLYEEAKEAVIKSGKASTSFLQRTLKIGYGRAARLIDILEDRGVVGPAEGATPRRIFEE